MNNDAPNFKALRRIAEGCGHGILIEPKHRPGHDTWKISIGSIEAESDSFDQAVYDLLYRIGKALVKNDLQPL